MWNPSEKDERMVSEAAKGSMEDKLYENSRTDSGFLSGNLTAELSEEIRDSGPLEEDDLPKEEEKSMRLDSGVDVCLSQTFSDLSLDLKQPGLNDLSSTKARTNDDTKNGKSTEDRPPWELYYRQDEDGDT